MAKHTGKPAKMGGNSLSPQKGLASKITKKFVDKIIEGGKNKKGEKGVKGGKFTCLDIGFKNNDQLKTNTDLQMPALECCCRGESAKIEFKVNSLGEI